MEVVCIIEGYVLLGYFYNYVMARCNCSSACTRSSFPSLPLTFLPRPLPSVHRLLQLELLVKFAAYVPELVMSQIGSVYFYSVNTAFKLYANKLATAIRIFSHIKVWYSICDGQRVHLFMLLRGAPVSVSLLQYVLLQALMIHSEIFRRWVLIRSSLFQSQKLGGIR